MIRYFLYGSSLSFIMLFCHACSNVSAENQPSTTSIGQKTKGSNPELAYQLVWSDEFNDEGLPDQQKWSYDVGTGCELPCGCGWGNAELQNYTKENKANAMVNDGILSITAKKEQTGGSAYSSARLVSKQKGDWTYGKISVRAKLPSGRGIWPAIWMLPTENQYGGWPKSGEIDIMEHVGYNPDTIFGTVHTEKYNGMIGTQIGGQMVQKTAESQFHIYTIEWTEDKIEWFIDDKKYFEYINEENGYSAWPFDQDFHLLLNVAVGGHWGGAMGVDSSIFPQQMLVDYVRVYQKTKNS